MTTSLREAEFMQLRELPPLPDASLPPGSGGSAKAVPARRLAAAALSAGALLALLFPALLNGFPLTFYDTGAYLARAFEGDLAPGRGPFYGFFIALLGPATSLWPVIAAQAAMVLYLVHLTVKSHGLGGAMVAALVTLGLAALTGVAWVSAKVMPDVFTPVVVLGWYLLAFRGERLSRCETALVAALLFAAVAVHMAHLALALGLALATAAAWAGGAGGGSRRGRALAAGVLGAALLALPLANFAASRYLGFTPGAETFLFGRLVESGIVARFLDERCPAPEYRLCALRASLPKTAVEWIWDDDGPFQALGGWQGYREEMTRITLETLKAYPAMHLGAALEAAALQFVRVAAGEDIAGPYWHTRYIVEKYTPNLLADYLAAAQEDGRIKPIVAALDLVYVPVAYASLAAAALLLA
ncbi:MAG: hypothetical protein ACHQF3_09875, partial [Alphaproteobacteria bacterium]